MSELMQPSQGRRSPPSTLSLVFLTSVAALGMNVFLPSLPQMADHFRVDYGFMQLSVSMYLAANAILQILIGPISDKVGRRPVILWGLILFLLATLGCLYAPNATVFLGFRIAQAVVVAAMVISRAAIRDQYDAERAASLIGYVTMGMSIVPMIGPAIGGVMGEAYGWQAIFWLLFAAGGIGLCIAYFDFGETKAKSGLSLSQQFREYPELLRSPRFWGYSLASGLASGAFFSYLGGAPYVGTTALGLEPAVLGLYFGAPAVGYFFGNYVSGRYSARIGINRMVLWGCIICAAGTLPSLVIELAGHSTPFTFFGIMALVGLGNGMTIPNATAGALSVRPHLAATASGLSGALMLGIGAALSSLAGVLVQLDAGTAALLLQMCVSAILAIVAILLVIRRAKQIGA
jgi:DHA1 family bicyclomycin/chloramphenicol resistance-like MFS transporter